MKKLARLITLTLVLLLCFSSNVIAEGNAEGAAGDSVTVLIIIASVLAFAATVSVILVNNKTKKYRKAFKKKRK